MLEERLAGRVRPHADAHTHACDLPPSPEANKRADGFNMAATARHRHHPHRGRKGSEHALEGGRAELYSSSTSKNRYATETTASGEGTLSVERTSAGALPVRERCKGMCDARGAILGERQRESTFPAASGRQADYRPPRRSARRPARSPCRQTGSPIWRGRPTRPRHPCCCSA